MKNGALKIRIMLNLASGCRLEKTVHLGVYPNIVFLYSTFLGPPLVEATATSLMLFPPIYVKWLVDGESTQQACFRVRARRGACHGRKMRESNHFLHTGEYAEVQPIWIT
jgi:hypothetical protein